MFQEAPVSLPFAGGAGGWSLFGIPPEIVGKLVLSVTLLASLVVGRRLVLRVIGHRVVDRTVMYRWSKISGYVTFVLGFVVILQVWFTALRSIGTFLGLLSAGIAIALKDPLADLAGWLFILWRKPFEVGDRIQIAGRAGDVVDTRFFSFTMMEIGNWVSADQSTGRLIHVPNSKVFTEPLANYTASFPFLWNELPVRLTFESDWRKAQRILTEIVNHATQGVSEEAEETLHSTSRHFLIHFSRLTPIVYTSVEEDGVVLTVRYLCPPRRRRGTAHEIWERVLEAFAEHDDIVFAHRAHRVYMAEGAPAPGGAGDYV